MRLQINLMIALFVGLLLLAAGSRAEADSMRLRNGTNQDIEARVDANPWPGGMFQNGGFFTIKPGAIESWDRSGRGNRVIVKVNGREHTTIIELGETWTFVGGTQLFTKGDSPPACQALSDKYAIVAGQGFGLAPADARANWMAMGCTTTPVAAVVGGLCQEMSNQHGIISGVTMGTANADVQGSWKGMACSATPTCQALSDKYAIVVQKGSGTFGFASADVLAYVTKMKCSTQPAAAVVGALCQQMSNQFGIGAGGTLGTAGPDVQGSWKAMACSTKLMTTLPSLTAKKSGTDVIEVQWSNGPGNPKDWIGIYPVGVKPGAVNATTWKYVTDSSTGSLQNGRLVFKLNHVGKDYLVYLLKNDGYEIVAGPVSPTMN